MAENLSEILEKYDIATLQAMLNFMGYKNQGPGRLNKADLVRMLQMVLVDHNRVVKAYAGLSPAGREAITVLQRQGGAASRGSIRRRLQDLGLLDARETRLDVYSNQQPDYRRTDTRYLDELMAHLLANGLVFGRQTKDGWGREINLTFRMVLDYFIPGPILALLPPPPELPTVLTSIKPPERIVESSARVFQRDLYLYWSYVYHNHPDLIAKGGLAKRHLTAVNETLLQRETIGTGQGEADFPRLLFLRAILTQLKLIESRDSTLQALPGEKFFGAEPRERIRRCFEAYVTMRVFNELHLQNPIIGYGNPVTPAPDPLIDARKTLALYFRLAADWTGIDDLINRVRETNYEFFLPRTYRRAESYDYYYSSPHPYTQYGNPLGWEWNFPPGLDEAEGWRRVEEQFIFWMISAAFYWMGLTDLGFRDPQGAEADAFCLTAIGRWLLAGGKPPEIPSEGGQVVVQPDYTILAFDPISDALLFNLEQFAQRVSAERAILYRMNQQSVYNAQRNGWDAARIQAYLEELSHQALPANVARTLAEWQAAHERIRILPHVNLLHAPISADLDELTNQKRVSPLLQHRPVPGVAVLPHDKNLGEVRRLLVELEWWPVITPRNAGLPARSVALDDQGRFRFLQRVPGLYLRAHLARFAEPDDDSYRLTPASIRRAANAGLAAPQIVAELNRVLEPSLPIEWEQRVLAWSGHFGQAQVEPVSLLHFKNDSAVAELLRDPQLEGLLRALRKEDLHHLAVVRAKDVERVRRVLEERGVEWKE